MELNKTIALNTAMETSKLADDYSKNTMLPKHRSMQISVVIPTCNRKERLLSLLRNLDHSSYPIHEVIIIDSGEDKLSTNECNSFINLKLHSVQSEKSVCVQRNIGIQKASSEWIFLCDDDIEIGKDYLKNLVVHISSNSEAGAVSGLWLQMEKGEWTATYPESSALQLVWKYFFQLSVWGEICCNANHFLVKKIKEAYKSKGNHISKAGWPVITDFSGEYFTTLVYSLGASLVKKEWLLQSPFDEVLDRYGIGENYGVIAGFPTSGIHVLNNTVVCHHREPANRLQKPLQYYRRTLALDYFIHSKKNLQWVKRRWLLWSLTGNLLRFILSANWIMVKPAIKSIWKIAMDQNPYYKAAMQARKIEEVFL
jgi:glycosyltransferase involved in cell wall biosynthesis